MLFVLLSGGLNLIALFSDSYLEILLNIVSIVTFMLITPTSIIWVNIMQNFSYYVYTIKYDERYAT